MFLEEKFDFKKIIIEIFGTVLGAFVMATGVSLFLLPNQLSSGGVSGIATITYYLFNIPMGTMILIINVPLFLFVDMLDNLKPITQDRFLACIYGGIIIGLGTAILLKTNSSTGGSDLISYLTKQYKPTVRSGEIIIN